MIRKLIRIGDSVGVTLDKTMLKTLGIDKETELWVEPDRQQKRIVIRKRRDTDW